MKRMLNIALVISATLSCRSLPKEVSVSEVAAADENTNFDNPEYVRKLRSELAGCAAAALCEALRLNGGDKFYEQLTEDPSDESCVVKAIVLQASKRCESALQYLITKHSELVTNTPITSAEDGAFPTDKIIAAISAAADSAKACIQKAGVKSRNEQLSRFSPEKRVHDLAVKKCAQPFLKSAKYTADTLHRAWDAFVIGPTVNETGFPGCHALETFGVHLSPKGLGEAVDAIYNKYATGNAEAACMAQCDIMATPESQSETQITGKRSLGIPHSTVTQLSYNLQCGKGDGVFDSPCKNFCGARNACKVMCSALNRDRNRPLHRNKLELDTCVSSCPETFVPGDKDAARQVIADEEARPPTAEESCRKYLQDGTYRAFEGTNSLINSAECASYYTTKYAYKTASDVYEYELKKDLHDAGRRAEKCTAMTPSAAEALKPWIKTHRTVYERAYNTVGARASVGKFCDSLKSFLNFPQ